MQNAQVESNKNLIETPKSSKDELSSNGFGERLTLAIGDESFNSFAKRANMGESLLRSYVKGTTPRLDKVIAIAETAQVNLEWLATGEGSMRRQRSTEEPVERESSSSSGIDNSVVDQASNRKFFPQNEGGKLEVVLRSIEEELFEKSSNRSLQDLMITQVQNDSMLPTLRRGDWIFIDSNVDPSRIVEGLYAFQMDGIVLIKRFIRQPGNTLKVVSDSSIHEFFTINVSELSTSFSILGQIVAVIHIFQGS